MCVNQIAASSGCSPTAADDALFLSITVATKTILPDKDSRRDSYVSAITMRHFAFSARQIRVSALGSWLLAAGRLGRVTCHCRPGQKPKPSMHLCGRLLVSWSIVMQTSRLLLAKQQPATKLTSRRRRQLQAASYEEIPTSMISIIMMLNLPASQTCSRTHTHTKVSHLFPPSGESEWSARKSQAPSPPPWKPHWRLASIKFACPD